MANEISKKIFNKFGLYDETIEISSDWEKIVKVFIAHRRFYGINLLVANFYLGGLSSNKKKIIEERQEIIDKYLKDTNIVEYSLFNFIPLLSIEDK